MRPQALSYCGVLGGAFSYERGTPVGFSVEWFRAPGSRFRGVGFELRVSGCHDLTTRDPVQGFRNLNGTSGAVGGAVFGNFPHIICIFCQLSARSVKILTLFPKRNGIPGGG